MKEIPPEVFKWLFEQQRKGEQFSIDVTVEFVALRDGPKWHEIAHSYSKGCLLRYLSQTGYTEKSQEEEDNYIDELVAEYENSSEEGSPLGMFDFLERKGLLDKFFKNTYVFENPKDDDQRT